MKEAEKNTRKRHGGRRARLPKPPHTIAGFLTKPEANLDQSSISKQRVTLIRKAKTLQKKPETCPKYRVPVGLRG